LFNVLLKALVLSSNPAWTYYTNGLESITFSYLILNLAKWAKNIVYLFNCSSFLCLNKIKCTFESSLVYPQDLFLINLFHLKVFLSSISHSSFLDSRKESSLNLQTISSICPQESYKLLYSYVQASSPKIYMLFFLDNLDF
jgi:hypothetical protein